ncbi:hypothetical protein RHMOL_Rhmol01G0153900 [Rhododendron molle]|uniref:Uncharacterized protein n=1 Tax=Rhododendron molle TaxID=49168 RepID=A0ACC0Q385_RHOML|nr:hypothetical protein RHMOL_Rhmol01G0153900 [Rhododendron molle]
MVSERKRKRQNNEHEGVMDLATSTKRLTRSANTVEKMQTRKDKPRSGIPCKTEKGKVKKGKTSRAMKGKNTKAKGKKMELGMSKNSPEFPQKNSVQLDEAYIKRSNTDVLKLVKQYEGTGGSFKLGGRLYHDNGERGYNYIWDKVWSYEDCYKSKSNGPKIRFRRLTLPWSERAKDIDHSDTEGLLHQVEKSGNEVVEDTTDDETESEQDDIEQGNEAVTLRDRIRKLTKDNVEKDWTICKLRRESMDKNATISDLRKRITELQQTTTPDLGFESITAQFDKHHLEHKNVGLQTEIGGMLVDKDTVEEELEGAKELIDEFVTHSEIENVEDEEEEEEEEQEEQEQEQEEGRSFEVVPDEGGLDHIMVPDAKVDSTTVEAYTTVLDGDTPKRKRTCKQKKVDSSSLARNVKKTNTRVEKRLDDYVYLDLRKVEKKKIKQKWNPSRAPLIHLLQLTDVDLLHQIVDCNDEGLT